MHTDERLFPNKPERTDCPRSVYISPGTICVRFISLTTQFNVKKFIQVFTTNFYLKIIKVLSIIFLNKENLYLIYLKNYVTYFPLSILFTR